MNRFYAKKHLGQNFLIDAKAIQRIIASCLIQAEDTILEIGPGQGALTEHLLKQARQVIAVEKDPRMCDHLRKRFSGNPKLQILEEDFLSYRLAPLPPGTKVIGNLPYNISTPIIEKFLTERHSCTELFFTVQLEFGQRLAARPGTKDYGALTCFVQFFSDIEILFKIPPQSFRPIPKVTSCFLKMTCHAPLDPKIDTDRFFALIRQAFQQRRKKIRNALYPVLGDRLSEILKKTGINEDLRPENLTLTNYLNIARELGFIKRG